MDKMEKMKQAKKVSDTGANKSGNKQSDKKPKDGTSAVSKKEGDQNSAARSKAYGSEFESNENEFERENNIEKPSNKALFGKKENSLPLDQKKEGQSKSKKKSNTRGTERSEIFNHLERFDEKLEEPAYDSDLDILQSKIDAIGENQQRQQQSIELILSKFDILINSQKAAFDQSKKEQ